MFTINDGVLEKFSPEGIITTVTIPDEVHTINNCVFMDNNDIEKVYLPTSLKIIGGGAFRDCSNLSEVHMRPGVIEIGGDAFNGCKSLRYCVLPNTVKIIGNGSFSKTALSSLEIPYGVEVIEDGAFAFCKSLKSVTIPNSVKIIEKFAFIESSLQTIRIPASVEFVGECAFPSSMKEVTICSPNTKFSSKSIFSKKTKVRGEGFKIQNNIRGKKMLALALGVWLAILLGFVFELAVLIGLFVYVKKKYPFHKITDLDDLKAIFADEFYLDWSDVLPKYE